MDSRAIQCEEISSSSDILPKRPRSLYHLPRNISLIAPRPDDENLEEAQLTYFRNLALYISSLINRNIVSYEIHSAYDTAHLSFGLFPTVNVKFVEHGRGGSKMRCSVLRDTVFLSTLDVLRASNMLFDAFLEMHNNHLEKFQPKTSVAAGFPRQEFSCTDVIVETPNPDIRNILETWMPLVTTTPRIIHCGRLADDAVQALFWEVQANFFPNVHGVECSTAPMHLAIRLHSTFEIAHLYDSLLPIALFFRFVKGWIVGKEGFARSRELIFQARGLHLNKGVFKTFLNYENPLSRNESIRVLNPDGRQAHVFLTKNGAVVFQVKSERNGRNLSEDEVSSTLHHINFRVEELDEPFENLNDADYGDLNDYATVLANYELRH